MRFLLDTNVLSELRKRERCDRAVALWYSRLHDDDIFLSVLSVGEIRRGIELIRRRDAKSARALDDWMALIVREHATRILPIDREVAEEWGRLCVPDPLPPVDGLLAATARTHGLTLATRNTRDIAPTGVSTVNPFAPDGDST